MKQLRHAGRSGERTGERMTRTLSIITAIVAGIVLSGSAIATVEYEFDSRIAFVQGPDIFSMKPDGSDVRQLTNLGTNASAFWENWSPDGHQLVFSKYPNGPGQLWLMNADGSNQHVLLSEPDFDNNAPYFLAGWPLGGLREMPGPVQRQWLCHL